MFMLGFPLLLIPFAIYNIIAFLMPGVTWTGCFRRSTWCREPTGRCRHERHAHRRSSIFLLCRRNPEIDPHRHPHSIVDHALSLILFLGMLIEFILVKQAATATFFLLLVVSFVDVLGGFAVTLRSAQRDLTVEGVERVSP